MTHEEIRAIRRSKNMTQTELAKKAGIHLITVNRAEKTGNVNQKTLQKLIDALQENNVQESVQETI